ncbi:PRC-barrel domain-containing protein [Candidatus Saccharibacteria bacterium]|nr:PRC-barrel domain-containing protein [Candidatus Saccharibacteria bacterium]
MIGSKVVGTPVLSLHMGGEIAQTDLDIIDPENLKVIAYTLKGEILKDPEAGSILMTDDVRELSNRGLVIDSADRLVEREDVIRLAEIMELNFSLIGLKVVTEGGKKIGKIVDYTLDSGSFMVYQVIVQRPLLSSFTDPQLTINRSQIVEVDDFKITIKGDKEQIKIQDKAEDKPEFVPDFVNPFRKPSYMPSEEESSAVSDNESTTSE